MLSCQPAARAERRALPAPGKHDCANVSMNCYTKNLPARLVSISEFGLNLSPDCCDFHRACRSFSSSARNGDQYSRSRARSADSSVANACSNRRRSPSAASASNGRAETRRRQSVGKRRTSSTSSSGVRSSKSQKRICAGFGPAIARTCCAGRPAAIGAGVGDRRIR